VQLDPLWAEPFPAEQARVVQLLIEWVDVRMHGVEVRLRPNGIAGLVREVAGSRRAAA
jgi:site-specific DNA recombinase